ncbi:GNAT family N-acetyltransferase [Natrarchaeobius halalkaliphilus]|uniref:GNAT family N-acetyltransferase n=1 Tax=Natrarchaeobius halalkaliphilus TaxID=1679091 RepID=A0A3N6LLD1_9EURY|nr:GNAT family N-acetyltransferase [Natrarchaeobius halalkaliphilus]RQG87900.1 GNAT family N-acetyltransferase [Natrarchaeobius halalkaliphilus]
MDATDDAACGRWDNSDCTGTPFCPPRCPRFADRDGEAMIVELAQQADYYPLVSMYDEMGAEQQTMGIPPLTRGRVESWIERLYRHGWNLIAKHDGRVVGHVGVTPTESDEPEFVIFIAPEYQNRGLGSELMKHVIAYASDRGYDALTLDVARENRRAITVYRNVDFEVTGTNASEVEMVLSLDKPIAKESQLPPGKRDQCA